MFKQVTNSEKFSNLGQAFIKIFFSLILIILFIGGLVYFLLYHRIDKEYEDTPVEYEDLYDPVEISLPEEE